MVSLFQFKWKDYGVSFPSFFQHFSGRVECTDVASNLVVHFMLVYLFYFILFFICYHSLVALTFQQHPKCISGRDLHRPLCGLSH